MFYQFYVLTLAVFKNNTCRRYSTAMPFLIYRRNISVFVAATGKQYC